MDLYLLNEFIVKSENMVISLNLTSAIGFHGEPEVQNAVSKLIDAVINKQNVISTAGINGVSFGASRDDFIDTFSKISISIPIAPLIPTISKIINDTINTVTSLITSPPADGLFKDVKLTMNSTEVDIVADETLQANVIAKVEGLPIDIFIDLPYVFSILNYNGKSMVENTIENIKFENGIFTTNAKLFFPENRDAAQRIHGILGNVLFHRKVATLDTFGIQSIGFGFSKEKKVETFATVSANFAITEVVASTIEYVDKNRPIELADIQAGLSEKGVDAAVTLTIPPAPWLKFLNKIDAGVSYQRDESGLDVRICNVVFEMIDIPRIKLGLIPILEDPGISEGLAQAMVPLLTFKDFASYGHLGYIVMTGSKGHKLNAFEKAFFPASVIEFWHPLYINLVPTWPWNPLRPFELTMPVAVKLSFQNNGPFHLDLGHIEMALRAGDKEILSAQSEGNIVILNKNEGAGNSDPKKFKNMGTFVLKIPVNPFRLIEVLEQLVTGKGINIYAQIIQNGKPLPFTSTILGQLAQKGALNQLFPFLGVILSNIRLKVLGIELKAPVFDKIGKWIIDHLPGAKSNQHLLDSNVTTEVTTSLQSDKIVIISH